ncbi:MAG: hypothetical protein LDL38_10465 [Flavobacterium piscis]|nr:hypothetical protein [Flavobacterium piscis]
MKNILKLRQIALAIFLIISGLSPVFSQVQNSKLKDGTISSGSEKARPGAIFELESNSKGMLVSRLTTSQRDAIIPANLSNGLLIFNTTTNCFDYWNAGQNLWMSICGTQPPATLSIAVADCNQGIVNGAYKQGVALTPSNFMTIPVTVTQPGTYTISATTNNGYYFNASGAFPAAGSYILNLPGVGTPNMGYDAGSAGDAVKVSINGSTNDCSPNIFVERAEIDYALNCSSVTKEGVYNIGLPLTTSNKITLSVNVTNIGFWSISTNTINGYSFTGAGKFTTTGPQSVELLGTGTPLASQTDSFVITSNAKTVSGASCSGILVTVSPVSYTINCAEATPTGTYMQASPLNTANTIVLPVNVTATGKTTITTTTTNGMTFSSGIIDLSALGTQQVILNGTGTPLTPGNTAFTVTGSPGTSSSCTVNVTVAQQPIAYTINCGSITTTGSYLPGLAMTSANTMVVPVNVTAVGDYNLSTNTVNGISFSKTGTFTSTGEQSVTMFAAGTAGVGGTFSYNITSNSISPACTANVTVGIRKMNVLHFGDLTVHYGPEVPGSNTPSRAMLESRNNFGPNSGATVAMEGVNIFTLGPTTDPSVIKNFINANKIDVIIQTWSYAWDSQYYTQQNGALSVLNDFVKNKKGVLITLHAGVSDNADSSLNTVMNTIFNTSGLSSTSDSSNLASWQFASIADPIITGPFGDLKGRTINQTNGTRCAPFTSVPPNAVSLLPLNGKHYAFRHTTLGYAFFGLDTPFMDTVCGVSGTGTPIVKNGAYNSAFFGNLMAWAFKYAMENENVNYQI